MERAEPAERALQEAPGAGDAFAAGLLVTLDRGATLAEALDAGRTELSEVELEYLAAVNPNTFAAVDELEEETLVAVAARVGEVRLIDNTTVRVASPGGAASHDLGYETCNA
jgi:pantothenate synthetase